MRRKKADGDKVFDAVNFLLVTIGGLLAIYPIIFIISASFSEPDAVYNGRVFLWPVGFSLDGYKIIFQDAAIWRGYMNTILYTVLGTSLNVVLTVLTGFALAQKSFRARKYFLSFFLFTMFFSGGLVPLYLLIRDLHWINSIWAMIVPTAISMWNVIITRTFFQSNIPEELKESAFVEGASYTRFLVSIVLPLSKAIIAILVLFYAVGHWNSYFTALIYLQDSEKYPLQLVLRGILTMSQTLATQFDPDNAQQAFDMQRISDLIKYGIIIVASVPLLILYPFMQKYFVKGIMIGSIKG